MRKMILPFAVTMALVPPVIAQAAPNCTSEPKEKWMPEQAIAQLGYERVKTFKVSGACYEIYGYTKEGKKNICKAAGSKRGSSHS